MPSHLMFLLKLEKTYPLSYPIGMTSLLVGRLEVMMSSKQRMRLKMMMRIQKRKEVIRYVVKPENANEKDDDDSEKERGDSVSRIGRLC
jgi:hypothetical protein